MTLKFAICRVKIKQKLYMEEREVFCDILYVSSFSKSLNFIEFLFKSTAIIWLHCREVLIYMYVGVYKFKHASNTNISESTLKICFKFCIMINGSSFTNKYLNEISWKIFLLETNWPKIMQPYIS